MLFISETQNNKRVANTETVVVGFVGMCCNGCYMCCCKDTGGNLLME